MRTLIGIVVAVAAAGAVGSLPAAADTNEDEVIHSAQGGSDGVSVSGEGVSVVPGSSVPEGRWVPGDGEAAVPVEPAAGGGDGVGSGPVCRYEPLRFTTQEEQRSEIRPEEQRPGAWGWLVCDDGSEDFRFFPDVPAKLAGPGGPVGVSVDPAVLAGSVRLTPGVPGLRASPPLGRRHLVGLESWFWVDAGEWVVWTAGTAAGSVTVEVTATPSVLVVDPGDGSGVVECPGGGTPYDPGRAAVVQSSGCTHTYERAGVYTALVTVVYEASWSANIDPGPHVLDPVTPEPVPVVIEVAEAQAIVTD